MLGLSKEQLAARRKYVQAGDAAKIMAGEWRSVWREKKGLVDGEDLSGVLPVQLGSMTEPFNLAWAERTTGREINYYSGNPLMRQIWLALHGPDSVALGLYASMNEVELQVSEAYPWMACNLDGMTTTPQGRPCVIDAKHVGRSDEAMLLRYAPGMVHQATVAGFDWWALSVLIGNSKHEVIYQEVDPLYQAELIAKERAFWRHVEADEEPQDEVAPVAAPKPQPKRREILLDQMRREDWPNWSSDFIGLAKTFAQTKSAADLHAITRKAMSELVPEDIGLVSVGLVSLKRDGRGTTISLKRAPDDGEGP